VVATEVRVAGEHLVAPLTRQHDLDAGIAHGTTQQVLGDRMRVCERPLRVIDGGRKVIGQVGRANVDPAEFGTGSLRLRLGELHLVVVGVVEREREGAERPGRQLRRDAKDRTRVDAAAQIASDRHIRAQPQADRLFEGVAQPVHPLARLDVACPFVLTGIIPIPIRHDPDLRAIGQQTAAGRHLIDPLEERAIRRVRYELDVIERFTIPSERYAESGERLYFGREVNRLAVGRVVQRLDAKAVSRCEELTVA
jgi:hypothetical protein